MVLLPLLALAVATAPSKLTITPCNFEDAAQFSTKECSIELSNHSNAPIHISDVLSVDKGHVDEVLTREVVVAPNSSAYINVKIQVSDGEGLVRHYFSMKTDEPGQSMRMAEAKGFAYSILDQDKPTLDFGVVDLLKQEMPSKTIRLTTHDEPNFRLTTVASAPDYLDVTLSADGSELKAVVKRSAKWGLHGDTIKLATNSKAQPQVWISVQVDVHGSIVPADNPFAMGLMRQGNPNSALINLTARSGNLNVGGVKLEGVAGTAVLQPCVPASTTCAAVKVDIAKDQPTGQIAGSVLVDLPDFTQVLKITIWGMLVDKDTKVLDLQEEMKKAEALRDASSVGGKSAAPAAQKPIDFSKVLSKDTSDEVVPTGEGPLLRWTIENEALVHGYNIYRGTSSGGPFVRLNSTIILKRERETPADDAPSHYIWRDTNAVAGETYWYFISAVNNDGHKEALGSPRQKKVPLLPDKH